MLQLPAAVRPPLPSQNTLMILIYGQFFLNLAAAMKAADARLVGVENAYFETRGPAACGLSGPAFSDMLTSNTRNDASAVRTFCADTRVDDGVVSPTHKIEPSIQPSPQSIIALNDSSCICIETSSNNLSDPVLANDDNGEAGAAEKLAGAAEKLAGAAEKLDDACDAPLSTDNGKFQAASQILAGLRGHFVRLRRRGGL